MSLHLPQTQGHRYSLIRGSHPEGANHEDFGRADELHLKARLDHLQSDPLPCLGSVSAHL